MKKSTRPALITGILGIIGSIAAAYIGNNAGKTQGQQIILDNINSQIAIVNGENNTVTINNVDELVNAYIALQEKNNILDDKNTSYFNDIAKLKDEMANNEKEIQSLNSQLSASPIISFSNVGLSIDGNDIPINTNNAMITVDGEDYFSKEILTNLITENKNLTIKDNTIFIGKVISGKAKLIDQWIVNSNNVDVTQSAIDSYGNTHANSLYFKNYSSYIIYNLNEKYSLLKFKLSISQSAYLDCTSVLIIKADDEVVYISSEVTKTTKPFEEIDIPINNCSLLTIEYGNTWHNDCILSDIEVYN